MTYTPEILAVLKPKKQSIFIDKWHRLKKMVFFGEKIAGGGLGLGPLLLFFKFCTTTTTKIKDTLKRIRRRPFKLFRMR